MSAVYGLRNDNVTTASNLGVVTSSLRLFYVSGIKSSYPGTGPTWYDLSGNNTHCTLYSSGGTTYSANLATEPELTNLGEPPSFHFDGANDFGKFSQFSLGSAQSVSVWFKTTSAKSNMGLFGHCNGGPVGVIYGLNGGYPRYRYYSGAWLAWQSTTLVNTGTWKNLAWTKSGTSMSLYIDGILSQSTTLSADVGGDFASIASEWGPCNSDSYGAGTDTYATVFDGNIGAIMVHTKQLSAAEVLQNYNVFKNRYKA